MKPVLLPVILALRTVNRLIERVLNPVSALLTVAMLCTVVWTVVARLSGISAPWTEKVMLILLPVLAFTVAPVAYRRGANVALDLLRDAMPGRMRHVHSLGMHLVILVLLLVAFDLSLRKIGVNPAPLSAAIDAVTGLDLSEIRPFRARMKIPVIGIEWRTVFMVMPLGIGAMILANVELLARHALGIAHPHEPGVEPVRSFESLLSDNARPGGILHTGSDPR